MGQSAEGLRPVPGAAGRPGLLVAFEGIDGAGKSTQIRLLASWLAEQGWPVTATREPTDGPCGRQLRQAARSGRRLPLAEELALFLADRRQHVDEVLRPALANGRIVLTDRYYLSTVAYQGAAGGDPDEILAMNEAFAPRPDLVLVLELPVSAGLARIERQRGQGPDAFEQGRFLERVAAIFQGLAMDGMRRLAAGGAPDEVQAAIRAEVTGLLRRRGWLAHDPRAEGMRE
ncbi:MAG: dTMP kinase [Thermodesulfobacteriota bacterium]